MISGLGLHHPRVDQRDAVEETDPENPNRYMWKGEWRDMIVSRN
jgi:acyl-homoserine lactone acylase PvdQ